MQYSVDHLNDSRLHIWIETVSSDQLLPIGPVGRKFVQTEPALLHAHLETP